MSAIHAGIDLAAGRGLEAVLRLDALRGRIVDAVRDLGASTPRRQKTPAIAAPITATNQHAASVGVCECRELFEHGYDLSRSRVCDVRAPCSCGNDRFHQAGDDVVDMPGHGYALRDRASRAEALNIALYGR